LASSSDAVIFAGTVVAARPFGLDTLYRFEITESFVGADSMPTADVAVDSTSSCAVSFGVGVEYLVYAFKTDNGLATTFCSRTLLLSRAQLDIELLREFRRGAVRPRLMGTVHEQRPFAIGNTVRPLVGAAITATRGAEVITGASDERGEFAFIGLQPGRYRVSVSVPREFELSPATEDVRLDRGDGCLADVDFTAAWTPVHGVVRLTDGRPARAGVNVSAVPVDATRPPSEHQSTMTDDDGSWRFRRLEPGKYRIGVNLLDRPTASSPFAPTWYPGAERPSEAAIVEVDWQSSARAEIYVQALGVETTVRGVVVDETSLPVERAEVFLFVDGDRWVWSSMQTNTLGQFVLPALQGRDYKIRATRLDFPAGRPTYRDRASDLLDIRTVSLQEIKLVVRERP
jgi:hypothetical protein